MRVFSFFFGLRYPRLFLFEKRKRGNEIGMLSPFSTGYAAWRLLGLLGNRSDDGRDSTKNTAGFCCLSSGHTIVV